VVEKGLTGSNIEIYLGLDEAEFDNIVVANTEPT
jgi:hypothetical protein